MEQGGQGAGDREDLHPATARAQGGEAWGPGPGEEDRGRGELSVLYLCSMPQ